jgi:isoquinoline 1-oxidoreductase
VKVDPNTGEVTLKKVTLAMDVGTIVNPDGVRAQIEGSIFWGASLAMLEKGREAMRRDYERRAST